MKKTYFIIFALLFTLSCGNHNKSNTTNLVVEEPQPDIYTSLQETAAPKIAEDLSGQVVILYEKDFIERITALDNPKGFQYLGQTPCIVELYADWCKPCGYQSELMRILAPDYQGKVIFYKLNIDKAPEIKAAFNVENIPMILYFKPYGRVSTTVGYLNREKLEQMIAKLLLNS